MDDYGYGYWSLAIINIIIFGLFIFFIPFRKKIQRLPTSIYLAFIVALYTEMYGFPLTIYALSWFLGYQNPLTHTSGHILAPIIGDEVFFTVFHPLSNVMIAIGAMLVILGWNKIHTSKNKLVKTGLYAYIRHPQYLGFLVITLGMLIQWATLPTILMWPILAMLYYRLAKQEEKEMEIKFGEKYKEYKVQVPMLLPVPRLKRSSSNIK